MDTMFYASKATIVGRITQNHASFSEARVHTFGSALHQPIAEEWCPKLGGSFVAIVEPKQNPSRQRQNMSIEVRMRMNERYSTNRASAQAESAFA